ncbi:MAG: hypothetical protein H7Z43_09245 [Clostridia bacterium]|nr:hypothetical protein [Deltaproteobacteria bacterium]
MAKLVVAFGMLMAFAATALADEPVTVGIGWTSPYGERACFGPMAHRLERTVAAHGYSVQDAPERKHFIWLDIQVGKRREPEATDNAPNVTHLTAFANGNFAVAIADTTACGPELEIAVTERALTLLEQAARLAKPDGPSKELPYSYFQKRRDRFQGETQPLDLGIFAFAPGSSELSVGISARTTNRLFGGYSGLLGPEVAFWHDRGTTVWEPALTAGLQIANPIDQSLAWSWGLEASMLLDIWRTPDDKGVKFAGRLGVPVKFGVAYNHAVLTVMPYIRNSGLDLKVDNVTAYHAELWGILVRISWGLGGRR